MKDNQTNIKGLEEARAKFAYDKAKTIADVGGKKAKEYKSYAKKLPMMIKSNGLGVSLAFAFSKGKDGNAWELLYNDIQSWLRQEHKKILLGNYAQTELVHAVVQLDSTEYRAVAVEVLAFLNWLRRFAEGLIEGEADND
ncbi:type III-B CRISPR module-associated protein Cmr5 [Haliscomenobacter sp.]|uniref:type III-B CRISPR module-associated protein Cmr5 n=1 Tax=Haliscomenobacter sp. TaxID=2717303 RepID=UPI003593776D